MILEETPKPYSNEGPYIARSLWGLQSLGFGWARVYRILLSSARKDSASQECVVTSTPNLPNGLRLRNFATTM